MRFPSRSRRDEFHELRKREKHKVQLDKQVKSWGEHPYVPESDDDATPHPHRWFGFLRPGPPRLRPQEVTHARNEDRSRSED